MKRPLGFPSTPLHQIFRLPVLAAILALALGGMTAGCSLFEDETFTATVAGRITDEVGAPVPGATVTATFAPPVESEPVVASTDEEGRYAFSFDVDGTEPITLFISAEVSGAVIGSRDVQIAPDSPDRSDVDFVLSATNNPNVPDQPSRESGTVSSIVVGRQSGTVIRVRESGGPETVSVTFVAIDSIGRRLASNRAVEMRFALGQNPGVGLAVNPTSIATNALGEATVVLTSGTRAGVVQLVAEATAADGSTVRSDPVRLTIHGGMPSQRNFSLGPTTRNIAGLVRYGVTTNIEVIVADKYANPVVPGSAVYFTTTHGIVGGSTETDVEGLGSVIMRSAEPLPPNGISVVTAETAGENEERVSAQTPVIFSGRTTITLQPDTAGFGSYNLTVDDPNGNPLTPGTTVNVSAEGTGVLVSGDTEVTLDDTAVAVNDANNDGLIQPGEVTVLGRTSFPFTVKEDASSTDPPEVTAIKVRVVSDNGNLDLAIFPPVSKTSSSPSVQATPGATVNRTANGIEVIAPAPVW